MVDKYTSLELSKKLAENGCKLDSEYWWYQDLNGDTHYVCNDTQDKELFMGITCYDILNDICVKYAKEFFKGLMIDDVTLDIFASRKQKTRS